MLPQSYFNRVGQESSPPQPYADKDVYRIYDLLVPHEETYCTKTRVIQQETIQGGEGMTDIDSCVSPEIAPEFQDAIANFKAANSKRWLLRRHFEFDRPYELVNSETIEATFKRIGHDEARSDPPLEAGWQGFYERYRLFLSHTIPASSNSARQGSGWGYMTVAPAFPAENEYDCPRGTYIQSPGLSSVPL